MSKTTRVSIPVMPAIAWDETVYCLNLEGGFIASLLGLGQILKLYRAWDGTDEEIEAVMAQVEKGLQELMGCVDCDGIVALETTQGGFLKASFANGVEQYIDQSSSINLTKMSSTQAEDNNLNNICSGARQMVATMLESVLFSLDQAQLTIDELKLASETANAILSVTFLAAVPTATAIYDSWNEWIFQAGDLGISTLKLAYSDPAVREKWVENIYCGIVDSGSPFLTKAIYAASTEDLPLLESQSTLLEKLFQGLSSEVSDEAYEVALKWYNLGALNEDNTCAAQFDCPGAWCYEFDFTIDDGGWFPTSPYNFATYTPGVGWVFGDGVAGSGGYRTADISIDLAIEVEITEIQMIFDLTKGTYPSGSQSAGLVGSYDDFPSGFQGVSWANNTISNGSNLSKTWSGSHMASTIRGSVVTSVDFSSPYSYSGSTVIKKITVWGTGISPFGEPNC